MIKLRPVHGYLAHKNSAPLGPYSSNMPGALWRPQGGELFLVSEVPLHLGEPVGAVREVQSPLDEPSTLMHTRDKSRLPDLFEDASLQEYIAHKKMPTPQNLLGP